MGYPCFVSDLNENWQYPGTGVIFVKDISFYKWKETISFLFLMYNIISYSSNSYRGRLAKTMKLDLSLLNYFSEKALKVGVFIWILLAFVILSFVPVKDNMFYYLDNDNLVKYIAPGIRTELSGQGNVTFDIELLTWKINEQNGFNNSIFQTIAHKAVSKSSRLPLSMDGFRNIVKADVAQDLIRSGEINQNDHFRVDINVR